jgi:hypothetical protein
MMRSSAGDEVGTALPGCAGQAPSMPREQRQARLRRDDDEPAMPQLARALRRSEPEARRLLDEAAHALRRKRLEAGCRLEVSDV